MQFQVLGVNHHTADVAVRERLSLGPDQVADSLAIWARRFPGVPLVILSTCNRTEWYTGLPVDEESVTQYWAQAVGLDHWEERARSAIYRYGGEAAARHLFRVAAGLDSAVLGESEILGQVKQAWQMAQSTMALGGLNRLFAAAVRVGKRARHETGIGKNALSIGHAVVELAERVLGSLHSRQALIVGAGEMAALAGRHLKTAGIGGIAVVNRTPERAQALAGELAGRAFGLQALPKLLFQHDVVVTATASQVPLVTRAVVREAHGYGTGRRHRFWFDLGVPRNIEPGVEAQLEGLFLYDIDDVRGVVEANRRLRLREVEAVERILEEGLLALKEELGALEAGPLIRLLRQKAERIRQEEIDRAFAKLPTMTPEERAVWDQTTRLILNKFLNDAMVSLRQWGQDDSKHQYLEAVRELFRLSEGSSEAAMAGPLPLANSEG